MGFFRGWRGAIGPQGVLPAAQISLEHITDGLPNVLDLGYSYVAIVLFSSSADQKCFLEITFFCFRDDLVKLANPMRLQELASETLKVPEATSSGMKMVSSARRFSCLAAAMLTSCRSPIGRAHTPRTTLTS